MEINEKAYNEVAETFGHTGLSTKDAIEAYLRSLEEQGIHVSGQEWRGVVPRELVEAMWAAASADSAGHYCAVKQIERAAAVAAAHYERERAELVGSLDDMCLAFANAIPHPAMMTTAASVMRRAVKIVANHQQQEKGND